MAERKRNDGIDLIKFICAFMVVAAHIPPFGIQSGENLLSGLNFVFRTHLSRIAVAFFFAGNGYFLARKVYASETQDSSVLRPFFIRVIKLYVIWSLIYLPVYIYENINKGQGILHGCLAYIRLFLVTGSYTHLWYLNALAVAALMIAICLRLKMTPKAMMAAAAVLYLLGMFDDTYYGLISGLPLNKIADLYNYFFFTTRNGVFYAFLFVVLGMLIYTGKPDITARKSAFMFAVSALCMMGELYLLERFSLPRDYSFYLFLIPSVYYLFVLASGLNMKDSAVNQYLGDMSKLIYYLHLLVTFATIPLFCLIPDSLTSTPLRYTVDTAITMALSYLIIRLSRREKFSWLKRIY